jgi:hypothetical protein
MDFKKKYLKYKKKYLNLKAGVDCEYNIKDYIDDRIGVINTNRKTILEYHEDHIPILENSEYKINTPDEIELHIKTEYNRSHRSEVVNDWIKGVWTEAFNYTPSTVQLKENYEENIKFKNDDLKELKKYTDRSLIKTNYIDLYDEIISNPLNQLNFKLVLWRWSSIPIDSYIDPKLSELDSWYGTQGKFPTITGASQHKYVTNEFYSSNPNACCFFKIYWPRNFPIIVSESRGIRSEVILPPFTFGIIKKIESEDKPTIVHIIPLHILDLYWGKGDDINCLFTNYKSNFKSGYRQGIFQFRKLTEDENKLNEKINYIILVLTNIYLRICKINKIINESPNNVLKEFGSIMKKYIKFDNLESNEKINLLLNNLEDLSAKYRVLEKTIVPFHLHL